jgi:hypothetical protein
MSDADDTLRLADIWAFCHARLNETARSLLASQQADLAEAEATPYRDVEFGLADIAFKRVMLEEHAPAFPPATEDAEAPYAVCQVDGDTCLFAQHLAGLYGSHPDYKEGWRP